MGLMLNVFIVVCSIVFIVTAGQNSVKPNATPSNAKSIQPAANQEKRAPTPSNAKRKSKQVTSPVPKNKSSDVLLATTSVLEPRRAANLVSTNSSENSTLVPAAPVQTQAVPVQVPAPIPSASPVMPTPGYEFPEPETVFWNLNGLPRDCSEVFRRGNRTSGIYRVQCKYCPSPLQVYCDMDTTRGGWTVFQRRGTKSFLRNRESFFRNWSDYAQGFGNLSHDFWIGNDNLFAMTYSRRMRLRIELQTFEGEGTYQEYDNFRIESEVWGYSLHYKNSSGPAGDSLKASQNNRFVTYDRDNNVTKGQRATDLKGGWWYGKELPTVSSNLNGLYIDKDVSNQEGVTWGSWQANRTLRYVEMKFRPVHYLPSR